MVGLSGRHFRRQCCRYEADGLEWLRDKPLGRVSARRAPETELDRMHRLYREESADFTVTADPEQQSRQDPGVPEIPEGRFPPPSLVQPDQSISLLAWPGGQRRHSDHRWNRRARNAGEASDSTLLRSGQKSTMSCRRHCKRRGAIQFSGPCFARIASPGCRIRVIHTHGNQRTTALRAVRIGVESHRRAHVAT